MAEQQNKAMDFPGQIEELPGGGIVLSKLDDLVNWARSNSLWPLTFATSCCGIEMMAVASAKYDFSRFGFEVARATPRQADVIIIAGTIVNKMAPVLKRLYDQMADPKYEIVANVPPSPICPIKLGAIATTAKKMNEELKQQITSWLPEATFDETGEWLTAVIPPNEWKKLASQLRYAANCQFDYLFCVTC